MIRHRHPGPVKWATGAGAPAFGARELPSEHRPGIIIGSGGKLVVGARDLSQAEIDELLAMMRATLSNDPPKPPSPNADIFTSARQT